MAERRLTLEDIADLRAYERERPAFRQRIIELKSRRRVAVGPLISVVFENRETVRFQIQEMARAERMVRDEQILGELEVYNPLIPEPGELSATLFLELTDEEALRTWLPRLVGIERSMVLRLADGQRIGSVPEEGHAEQLTRQDVTASVHYVRWRLDEGQVEQFARGGVVLAAEHPEYRHETELAPQTIEELMGDLRP